MNPRRLHQMLTFQITFYVNHFHIKYIVLILHLKVNKTMTVGCTYQNVKAVFRFRMNETFWSQLIDAFSSPTRRPRKVSNLHISKNVFRKLGFAFFHTFFLRRIFGGFFRATRGFKAAVAVSSDVCFKGPFKTT